MHLLQLTFLYIWHIIQHILLIDTFAYLEHIGICHRDIKPTNLFLLENYQIKVIDFGESIVNYDDDDEEDNQVATIRGTPQYLSPKLWEDHVIKKAKEVELGIGPNPQSPCHLN